ncbi:MAG: hypothetical protein LC541_20085 [Candidatus Thiodiazotropha sp.]|nr:hypothetical protein [Candidatus Thiodiazotropha sp.]MCM8885566.1 hypothetical protein [Candidatus Thiodiazotropha sp.]MCM8922117.1 hypothetical protein [Candidatus Thiodiazotropha sp.]
MERIFQHYEGSIEALKDVTFSEAKAFINKADNDVILIWLKNDKDKSWYRVFIDGAYCGVDLYQKESYEEDLDDHVKIIDYSSWFNKKKTLSVFVTLESNNGSHIVLTFKFSNSICQLICKSTDGDCILNYKELNNA